jgi:YVTN family beta-propeller protein
MASLTVFPSNPAAAVCAYVANSGSDSVSVIDSASSTVTATIPVGIGPRAVVVTPDSTRVYVANGVSRTLSVIDTATNTVVDSVPAGRDPRDLAITPNGERLYVSNGSSDAVAVIDVATSTFLVEAIAVGASRAGLR